MIDQATPDFINYMDKMSVRCMKQDLFEQPSKYIQNMEALRDAGSVVAILFYRAPIPG